MEGDCDRPIRAVIFDHCELSREGLARLLQDKPQFAIVAACRDDRSFLEHIKRAQPDLVIVKEGSPSIGTGELIRGAIGLSPYTKVAILGEQPSHRDIWAAIEGGATGYFSRADIGMADFVASIELMLKGLVVISESVARTLVEGLAPSVGNGRHASQEQVSLNDLSKREQEIVALVSTGATNGEIAKTLFLQESTVKVHMRNILEKLRFKNRQQVVAFAVRNDFPSSIFPKLDALSPAHASVDNLEQI